ncbi:MAG: thiamine pyrophosphate-binding protein [Euryarchaeota archaeon]|nr:thiamine pyrophosphate-binding protein [Euryarchaeota archaeon]
MKSSERFIRCSDALVRILESEGVKFIFGHPGEQILPFYDALKNSPIKHILMRHEQGAAHAADGYARVSGNFGVCVASAGPGALNLVMGIATAYKDSIPLIVITGDVPTQLEGDNVFQEIDTVDIFKPITLKTFNIQNGEDGILKLKEAVKMIKYGKKGPVYLNFPKDILNSHINESLLNYDVRYQPKTDFREINDAIELIKSSKRPLILAGAGIIWSGGVEKFRSFVEKVRIPVVTTYHARGVLSEDNPLSLGMVGLRGTEAANFAGRNCDVLIALGSRFSERTTVGLGDCKIIHVNIDENVLMGDIKILGNIGAFLKEIENIETQKWIDNLQNYPKYHEINIDYAEIPIKPQKAVAEILDASEDSTIVNDAGSHTTWVTLLKKVLRPSSLIFSGGFGPMGYGVPAAVGASLANLKKSVVVITGDGGFQMTSQELATVAQEKLPIVICIINNESLGIIKQWQETFYKGGFQVELENPDFLQLAKSYHINAERVDSPGDVFKAVKEALKLKKPYLIDVMVDKEEMIPLPKVVP